jgi:predicted RNA-binding protein Jag
MTMTVEATGETVSEAKWRALQELERLEPTLDRAAVRFQVLEEGHRGLLGVGYTPARVVASAEPGPAAGAAVIDESELAAQLRDLLTHVTAAFGLRCRIDIDESDESLTAVCTAADLGLLIGRRGRWSSTLRATATGAGAPSRRWPSGARRRRCAPASPCRSSR